MLNYGRLSRPSPAQPPEPTKPAANHLLLAAIFLVTALLLGLFASACLIFLKRPTPKGLADRAPTEAIARTCQRTLYPELCVSSLAAFPGASAADEADLVHVTLNMTRMRVTDAANGVYDLVGLALAADAPTRAAYGDCLDMFGAATELMSQSFTAAAEMSSSSSTTTAADEDIMTWLSAALTNVDTCGESLDEASVDGELKAQMLEHAKDIPELLSNSLAIYATTAKNGEFTGVPIHDRGKQRKLLNVDVDGDGDGDGFPHWLEESDRRLLSTLASDIEADFTVSKDGNGTHKRITDAIKAAPDRSSRRIVIRLAAGRYEENVRVGRKKTNIMLVGNGKNSTIITASRSVADHYTTFHTATVVVAGSWFIMRDLTVENTAGPEKHQAVALRVSADHAVVSGCNISGYQDTLYAHTLRQFYRECDISGTVDVIFGNAAVVLQRCNLWARVPLPNQKNTMTAQGRRDPNQNTGISIHDCSLNATAELEAAAAEAEILTFLGRPWKPYSRTVYMLTYIGELVDPAGWIKWNGTDDGIDTLYYGEYMNYGPGAAVGKRVDWPGYHVITLAEEAARFTVAELIDGDSWLPRTGVAFVSGLTE